MNSIVINKIKIYAELMRLDKPIGSLLLLWPTYWALWLASAGQPKWILVLVFTLGTFLMRSAGCVINDFADRKIDGKVLRTQNRPFARGVVTKKEALFLVVFLFLLAMLCLIPLNKLTWLLSLIAIFLALSYPFTKRFFAMPQFYLGLAYSFGIPMAYAATLNQVPTIAWVLFVANLFWTLAYDTLYAIADKPDDLKLGIHSSAITLGKYDIFGVMLFYACFILLLLLVGVMANLIYPYWIAVVIVAVLQLAQYSKIKNKDRLLCFDAFLQNNWFGMIIFLGIVFNFKL